MYIDMRFFFFMSVLRNDDDDLTCNDSLFDGETEGR